MARRSKRNRAQDAQRRGSQPAAPPPFPFPEGPRGFRLRWLNTKDEEDPDAFFVVDKNSGVQKIGQFTRNLPDDLMDRSRWIEQHIPTKGQPQHPMRETPDDWCATMWHGLHHGWQYHRERGVQGFLSHQIELMGGLDEVAKLGGMFLSVTLLPEGRRVTKFAEPHIVLAVEPDGEFCRLLATEYWGPVAIGIAAERGMDTILGPVSVGLMGMVLVDGKPYPHGSEGLEPTLMLIDPLTVLADLGPVTGTSKDGMLEYMAGTWDASTMGRLYHPDDTEARRHMHPSQKGFLDLWDGQVPGFVGRIGTLHHKVKEAKEQRRQEQAKIPINPLYMEALERQLQTARFVHDRKPFATVRQEMGMRPTPQDYDAAVSYALDRAQTHYWTPQMSALLEKSYPTLPQWWLKPQEVGPRFGYMWFAEPIQLVPDDQEKLRAMLWFAPQDGTGYVIIPFTIYDGAGSGFVPVATFADLPYGAPRHMLTWKEGMSLTDWLTEEETLYETPAYVRERTTLSGLNEMLDKGQRLAWGRIFATAVTIMNQTLVKVEPYGADRAARKRIERLRPPGLDPPHPLVKAILLRRQYTVRPGIAPDSEPIDWSCQWVVHEHWRQQYYPSTQEHKWILIADHIKGPPDKPLKDPLPIKLVGR